MNLAYLITPALAAGAIALAAPAHADIFTMCPDGHEGVVGGHTSCAFAANVRRGYYLAGSTYFVAYSPVTGESYPMSCDSHMTPASFVTGEVLNSVRCFGGDGAEVVVW